MGPLANGIPVGASHGIGNILSTIHDVPDGYTSCLLLPQVMRWNKPVNALHQVKVTAALGGKEGDDAADLLEDLIRSQH